MGIIRTLLALAVVYEHAAAFGIIPPYTATYGYSPVGGTLAVQMFFVISGFYMSLVLTERYRALDGWLWRFWTSRYLRLMPTYLVVLLVTMPLQSKGFIWPTSWQRGLFEFSSLTLIGIDTTSFYSIAEGPAGGQLAVAQAWSIGIELWFYMLVPALAKLRTTTLGLIAAVLLLIWGELSDVVPMFPWQERLFPLQLWFFVSGMLAHRFYASVKPDNPIVGYAASAIAIIIICFSHRHWTPTNALFIPGALAMLLPFIFAAYRTSAIDRHIGDLSYPIYMVHMTVMGSLPIARTNLGLALFFTLAAAITLYIVIERPIDTFRQRITATRTRTPSLEPRLQPSYASSQCRP